MVEKAYHHPRKPLPVAPLVEVNLANLFKDGAHDFALLYHLIQPRYQMLASYRLEIKHHRGSPLPSRKK